MKISNFFHLYAKLGINSFTLSFKDKKIEESFMADFYESSVNLQRLSIFIAISVFALFGLLDFRLFSGEDLSRIHTIRYIIALPFAFVLFTITFLKINRKYWQGVLSINIINSGLSIVAIIIALPAPISYYNFPGLMLVLFYSYIMLRLRFVYSIFTGFLITGSYMVAAQIFIDLPNEIYFNNSFFYLSTNLMGLFASYMIELYVRKDFYLKQLLEKEKDNINKLLENEILLNKMKSRFLNTTSHVFRNPLTAIMTSSQVLDELLSKSNSNNALNYNSYIYESANQILNTLNRIQFIVKFESGNIKYNPNKVNVDLVIEQAIEQVKKYEKKSFVVYKNIPEDFSFITTDNNLLTIVLTELLSNSVRYTPKDTKLHIEAYYINGMQTCLKISDNGPGIVDNINNLKFTTYDYVNDTKISGIGLGFTIVKSCLSLMDSQINHYNNDSGGSTFEVLINSK